MKKTISLLAVALVALLTGCHAQDTNATAFQAAAKNVASVKNVVVPGDASLDAKITALGGYPAAADVATSKKATDTQYSIGYDASHKAVVAVSLAKDGTTTVVTDPDLITGYVAKVKSLSGEKSTASTGSGSGSSGDSDGASSHASGGVPKGCPVKIGDSKATVRKKLGSPTTTVYEGTDHEEWFCTPLQSGDLVDDVAGSITAPIAGLFGGTSTAAKSKVIKKKHYIVDFSGDSVASVKVSTSGV